MREKGHGHRADENDEAHCSSKCTKTSSFNLESFFLSYTAMNQSLKEQFHRQTSGAALPLIAVGIGINLVMGELTAVLKIPLYLDSVGTIFIAASCGMFAAIVCGLMSNIAAGIMFNPAMIFFAPVSIVVGVCAGYFASKNGFSSLTKVIAFGLLQGIITAIMSAPISAFVFGGITLGGTDFLVLYFRAIGQTLLNSVLYQGLTSDPIDKCVSYVLVFFILKQIPGSLRNRFPQSNVK
jgi:energy-coupling factor transport system substrate-specific component